MDRKRRSVGWRLAIPLVAMGTAALWWLGIGLPNDEAQSPLATAPAITAPPPASPTAPAPTAPRLDPPTPGRVAVDPQTPGRLAVDPHARWLMALDDRTRSILSVGCPMGEADDPFLPPSVVENQSGPLLGAALAASSSVVSREPAATETASKTITGAPTTTQPVNAQGATAAAPRATPEHPSRDTVAAVPSTAEAPAALPAPTAMGAVRSGPAEAGRAPRLDAIADEADKHSRRAFELAGRNALFSARAEFITALRLVAQGLDTELQTDRHEKALVAALTALRESDDFISQGAKLERELNVELIVRGHRTPALRGAGNVSPLEALQRYFTFAQEQLALSAEQEVAGSMALHGLGKLHAALATQQDGAVLAGESKAVSFYQAALLVCPRNFMASNDLGVLLARCGRPAEARLALEHSVSLQQSASGWHNLATVYRQLGLGDRAFRATQLVERQKRVEALAQRGQMTPSGQVVQWVDAQRFAESYTGSVADLPLRSPGGAPPAVARPATPWAQDYPRR